MFTMTGLFLSVLVIAFLAAFLRGAWIASRSIQSEKWPTTTGILKSLAFNDVTRSGDSPTYGVRCRYTYCVDGVEYEGSRITFGYSPNFYRPMHDEVYKALKGAETVDVRYSPTNPSLSCLYSRLHQTRWWTLAFSTVLLAFWGLVSWFILRT